ncbi:hypothetical protein RvY_02906 [Ramazzottius varieornatus]|uniref:Uncharacterized protein n=1 Tax=Ramazzottius varieornatus TaxID=947166 RepID=A0A1D1UPQ5_RAMVA|nr:hypothetical protein RvY_02906 [Ramazzottius varieornatus]
MFWLITREKERPLSRYEPKHCFPGYIKDRWMGRLHLRNKGMFKKKKVASPQSHPTCSPFHARGVCIACLARSMLYSRHQLPTRWLIRQNKVEHPRNTPHVPVSGGLISQIKRAFGFSLWKWL